MSRISDADLSTIELWGHAQRGTVSDELGRLVLDLVREVRTLRESVCFVPASAPIVELRALRDRQQSAVVVAAASRYRVAPSAIMGRSREHHITGARKVAFGALHRLGWTYSDISERFGRERTTVMHAVGSARVEEVSSVLAAASQVLDAASAITPPDDDPTTTGPSVARLRRSGGFDDITAALKE